MPPATMQAQNVAFSQQLSHHSCMSRVPNNFPQHFPLVSFFLRLPPYQGPATITHERKFFFKANWSLFSSLYVRTGPATIRTINVFGHISPTSAAAADSNVDSPFSRIRVGLLQDKKIKQNRERAGARLFTRSVSFFLSLAHAVNTGLSILSCLCM